MDVYNIPYVNTYQSVNPWVISDNIGYKYNKDILIYLSNLIYINNNYCKLKYRNTCRYIKFITTTKSATGESVTFKGRVYNALCLTKSGKRSYNSQDKRILRSDFLKVYGYGDYFEVFDIKSEIPRLTYILQGGNYDDIDDFYKVPGYDRKIVKKFFMNCYFGKSSKSEIWHTLRRFLQENNLKLNISAKNKETWKQMFETLWNYYHTIIKPIGPEIFLWTSLWEQLIIKEAREQLGVNLLNVYDAFYYNDASIKDDLNRIAKETSVILRTKYEEIKGE
jgi:hypothetical protein